MRATSASSLGVGSVDNLMSGPLFSREEGVSYSIYKFDFKEFSQSEIHLSINENKVLEVKASREICDAVGRTYREFKREIQLAETCDVNLIKNILADGVLTLKIPNAGAQSTAGVNNNAINTAMSSAIVGSNGASSSQSQSLTKQAQSSSGSQQMQQQSLSSLASSSAKATSSILKNSSTAASSAYGTLEASASEMREVHTSDGKLVKLVTDLNGYDPENLKIVLSANNILKVSAHQSNVKSGIVVKKFQQEYPLPSYIQPENMKAIMSKDGVLTIDFSANAAAVLTNVFTTSDADQRIHLKA